MKVKVGKICNRCQWFGSYTRSCSYCDLNHKSRLRDENGNRTDPAYCDKFIEGKSTYDFSQWGDKGIVKKGQRG